MFEITHHRGCREGGVRQPQVAVLMGVEEPADDPRPKPFRVMLHAGVGVLQRHEEGERLFEALAVAREALGVAGFLGDAAGVDQATCESGGRRFRRQVGRFAVLPWNEAAGPKRMPRVWGVLLSQQPIVHFKNDLGESRIVGGHPAIKAPVAV